MIRTGKHDRHLEKKTAIETHFSFLFNALLNFSHFSLQMHFLLLGNTDIFLNAALKQNHQSLKPCYDALRQTLTSKH